MLGSLGCCKMQHFLSYFVAKCHISRSIIGISMKFLMRHPLWQADTPGKYKVAAAIGRVAAGCHKLDFFAASCFFSSRENEINKKLYIKYLSCLQLHSTEFSVFAANSSPAATWVFIDIKLVTCSIYSDTSKLAIWSIITFFFMLQGTGMLQFNVVAKF